jgi:hypothetical protein
MSVVKDGNFGLRGDMERGGRRREAHRFVKAGLKLARGSVHQDDSRTLIDADDAANSAVKPDDIAGMKPEGMRQRLAKDADKLRLRGVGQNAFGMFHNIKNGAGCAAPVVSGGA